MTGCRRAFFVDTAPFIYCIEENKENPQYYSKVQSFFEYCYNNDVELFTSVITTEEYCVMPYKTNELQRIELFRRFLNLLGIRVEVIDEKVAEKVSQIRAKYPKFKSMDALQLAAACDTQCELFYTNDKQLRQFKEIKVFTIDDSLQELIDKQ